MKLSVADSDAFQKRVRKYYHWHGRGDLPWRQDTRPYYILVSELMLQQTQVPRVIPKFRSFTRAFPSFQTLAEASLTEVLTEWMGLGYNRRARFLHAAAQKVVREYGGKMPRDKKSLEGLPGVGPNTAGAILACAFNQPVVFIETNIRTVYIHAFFADEKAVSDADIAELARQTLDSHSPREWYWALMDYGTYLKTTDNNIARSKHYKKQSRFAGSLRQMRGQLLRQLQQKPQRWRDLQAALPGDERVQPALDGLLRDKLVEQSEGYFYLTGQNVR